MMKHMNEALAVRVSHSRGTQFTIERTLDLNWLN